MALAVSSPTKGSRAARTKATEDRILTVALESFGTKGFDSVSLDDLAADLGITKQAILYHWPSKLALLNAVIDRAAFELIIEFDGALSEDGSGWSRVESVVRRIFRVAMRRPELLGFIREISRIGGDASLRVTTDLEPFVTRATVYFEREMDAGRIRRCNPGLLLVSAYSTVLGAATEVEVLRAVGIEPTLRSTVVRRRELLSFLYAAMAAPESKNDQAPR
ncbi:MAG: TetR/AcrR family transcriptional regulator [Acidimicrobiales bacterium]